MSEIIAFGGDVSKGRIDVVVLNQSGTVLPGSSAYDDTHAGHVELREHIRRLETAHPNAEIRVAVEATGGYENNWLKLFRDEHRRGKRVTVYRLNPLAVKRFMDVELHRVVNDQRAARGIAAFLLNRTPQVVELEPSPEQAFYRLLRAAKADRGVLAQQLQMQLNQVHPELVSACRGRLPVWLLTVLGKYPTAAALARARPATLAALPHVGAERAATLIANATTSVASATGPAAAAMIGLLVERFQAATATIERYTTTLTAMVGEDPRVALLDSITGIGRWTAICLMLEIGDIARFDSDRQLIAWAGLDPHDDISGDGVIHRGISKRGNAHLRALLYLPTVCARAFNPVIRAFYERLVGRGKTGRQALTAGMGKMLRIAFAVLVTQQQFDPDYEKKRTERKRAQRQPAPATAAVANTAAIDLTAPVGRLEAKRRRATVQLAAQQTNAAAPATPGAGSESQEATKADRVATVSTSADDATTALANHATLSRPVAGRHAGAMHPTKTASVGPRKGPKRCRPAAGRDTSKAPEPEVKR